MKYVCIRNGCLDEIVMFADFIAHDDMAGSLKSRGHPISAGFVREDGEGEYECAGCSESLGLESRERDTDLLRMAMKNPVCL